MAARAAIIVTAGAAIGAVVGVALRSPTIGILLGAIDGATLAALVRGVPM